MAERATHDLIVVGGGLVGLATAFEARQAGLSVLLLERDGCGRQASGASAGGVRSLGRALPEIPLARSALAAWDRLAGRLGADVGFRRSGQLRVAEDAAALAALEARAAETAAQGWTHERMLGRDALMALVPSLAPHCRGALVVADDGFADPLASLGAYRRAAAAAGVAIREGSAVRAIVRADAAALAVETDRGTLRARAVANCAGGWGAELVPAEAVPMRRAALQMIVTAPVAPFVAPVIGSQGRRLSLKQTAAGAVVIGGAFEAEIEASGRTRLLPERVAASLGNAARLFPALRAAAVLRAWAGIEGMVADGLPVIGPSRQLPGLVHGYGFSAHGFALAPLVGEILRDLVTGGATAHPVAAFAPDRFATATGAAGAMRQEVEHAGA